MWLFKKKEKKIAEKEQAIQIDKRKLHADMNKDIASMKRLNKVLSNGVTVEIYHAIGGKHAR